MGRDSQAVRLSSAAALPVPVVCSSLGGRATPTAADVTAVLAAVKVVRPTRRSTLTAGCGPPVSSSCGGAETTMQNNRQRRRRC
jgi:hypothetical protein